MDLLQTLTLNLNPTPTIGFLGPKSCMETEQEGSLYAAPYIHGRSHEHLCDQTILKEPGHGSHRFFVVLVEDLALVCILKRRCFRETDEPVA